MFKIKPKYFKEENTPLTYHTVFKVLVIMGIVTDLLGFLGKLLLVNIAQEVAFHTYNYEAFNILMRVANISWGYIALTILSVLLFALTLVGLFEKKWIYLKCFFVRYIVIVAGEILLFVTSNVSSFDLAATIVFATAWVIPTYIYYMYRRPLFSPYFFSEEDEEKAKEEEKKEEEKTKKEDIVYTYVGGSEKKETTYTYEYNEGEDDE